jgi:hypothetical protein
MIKTTMISRNNSGNTSLLSKMATSSFWNKKYIIWIILGAFFLFNFLLNLPIKTISIPSDEFNIMAIAARLAGRDWSSVMASGYYGYGAAFLYAPFFFNDYIIHNTYLLTQCILLVNAGILTASFFLTYKMITLLGKEIFHTGIAIILALIPFLFLPINNVAHLLTNDSLFLFSNIAAVFCIVIYLYTSSKIKKIVFSIFCAAFATLALVNNNRGVVTIIAIVFCFFLVLIIQKRTILQPVAFFLALIFFLCLHYYWLYPHFRSLFPADIYNTDPNIIFDRIPRLFTNISDMAALLTALLGWIYSFIVSTYGFGIFIIFSLFYVAYKFLRKTDIDQNLSVVSIVVFVFFIGTFLLCLINFLDSFQGLLQYSDGTWPAKDRADKLFYVRYLIPMIPIAFALCFLIIKKYMLFKDTQKASLFTLVSFVIIALLFQFFVASQVEGIRYAPSSSSFIGLFLQNIQENGKYGIIFSRNFLILDIFIIAIFLTFYLAKIKIKLHVFFASLVVLEVAICTIWSLSTINDRSTYYYNLVNPQIEAFLKDNQLANKTILMYGEDDNAFLYQYFSPDEKIKSLSNELVNDHDFSNDVFITKDLNYYDAYLRFALPEYTYVGVAQTDILLTDNSAIAQSWANYGILPLREQEKWKTYISGDDLYVTGNRIYPVEENLTVMPEQTQFGPYITMAPGKYSVTYWGDNLTNLLFKVTKDSGVSAIPYYDINITKNKVTYNLDLDEYATDIEFTALNNKEDSSSIQGIELEKID